MSEEHVKLWLQFRCRRCGTLFEIRGDASDLEGVDPQRGPLLIGRWHQCLDGGTGVAEFVGFRSAA